MSSKHPGSQLTGQPVSHLTITFASSLLVHVDLVSTLKFSTFTSSFTCAARCLLFVRAFPRMPDSSDSRTFSLSLRPFSSPKFKKLHGR